MNDKLKRITSYAYGNVEFYRRISQRCNKDILSLLNNCDWQQIPLITKEDVARNEFEMISDDYKGLYATNQLITAHTSGSSGIQVDVCWSVQDYYASLIPLWLERWKQVGIHPRDKVCYFSNVLELGVEFIYEKNALIFSKTNLTYDKFLGVVKEMEKFEPKWLLLHPSIALLLCEIVENEKIHLTSVKYIELTGETIYDSLRIRLETLFKCQVKGHYGSMEVNTIGYDRGNNQYMVLNDSTFVEILDDNGENVPLGEKGSVFVTSLQNTAMPFIRYSLGDIAMLEEIDGKQIITLEKARMNESIILRDGTKVNAEVLLTPLVWMSTTGEKMVYKIMAHQKTVDEVDLCFFVDDEIDRQEFVNYYLSVLDKRLLVNMNFRFEFVTNNVGVSMKNGKMRWFEGIVSHK